MHLICRSLIVPTSSIDKRKFSVARLFQSSIKGKTTSYFSAAIGIFHVNFTECSGPTCTVTLNGKLVNSRGEGFLGTATFSEYQPECAYDQFVQVRDNLNNYINRYSELENGC